MIKVFRTATVTPRDALDTLVAKGFKLGFIDEEALASAPLFETPEVDYIFDSLGKPEEVIKCNEVDNVFEAKHGSKHTPDLVGVCATLAADPTLVDAAPIAIQWFDGDGRYCYAVWYCWDGCREVYVGRYDADWGGSVRFPRARK